MERFLELLSNNSNKNITETTKTPIELALDVDDKGMTTAKKLYDFLELNPSHYARWCKKNIFENQFVEESLDFWAFTINGEWGGQKTTDYLLTASFAKKLCMTSNSPKGELARNYFIAVEKKLQEVAIKHQQQEFAIPQTLPEALRLAADLAEENEKMKPKAFAHDKFISAEGLITLAEAAKSLNIKNVGQNKLFEILRQEEILISSGAKRNQPYQEYINRGYFVMKQTTIYHGDKLEPYTQTFVTPRGMSWLANYLKERGYYPEQTAYNLTLFNN